MAGMGEALGAGRAGDLALGGLIPFWLGVAGALMFGAVLVSHLRHVVLDCPVPRRCWHWGHVVMAASMIVMYLPASVDPLSIPAAGWRAVFIVALGVLVVSGLNELFEHRAVSALWLLVAGDMVAMLYMWSPGVSAAGLSAVLGAFLLGEAWLWASERVVTLDRPLGPSLYVLTGSGVLGLAAGGDASTEVGATLELRISMVAMALGMAYMILAMALMA